MKKKRDRQIPESIAALTLLVGFLLALAYVATEWQVPKPKVLTTKERMWMRAEHAPMPRQLNTVRIIKFNGRYIREDTYKTIIWMSIGKKAILPEWDVNPLIDIPGGDVERAWLNCTPGVTKFVWSD